MQSDLLTYQVFVSERSDVVINVWKGTLGILRNGCDDFIAVSYRRYETSVLRREYEALLVEKIKEEGSLLSERERGLSSRMREGINS